jgi:chemosensory pili system protein ChpA (sensor histidine kinase/response regulator)
MPPITPISAIPPDFTRPAQGQGTRGRDRQVLGADVVEQVQRALGRTVTQAQLTAADLHTQSAAPDSAARSSGLRQPPEPPVDLVQRLLTERQAALRDAALQRDEMLQAAQQQNQPTLRLAQRESDRLQVLRDTQLLEAQRIAVPQVDTQRLDAQRLEGQRQTESALAAQDAERLETERLEQRREAERAREQEDTERLEQRRLEREREADRIQEQQDAKRVEAQRAAERVDAERDLAGVESERAVAHEPRRAEEQPSIRPDSERALAERAALAYRSESERAVSEANATRLEAAQPLNYQLQLVRERLDATEAQRIDRVDVSNAALSRLAY